MPCNSDAATPRQVQGLWVGSCLLALEILLWSVCERNDSKLTLPQGQTHFWVPIVGAVFWSTVNSLMSWESWWFLTTWIPIRLQTSHAPNSFLTPGNPLTLRGLLLPWPPGWGSWPCSRPLAALPSSPSGLKSQPDTCLALSLLQAGAADQPHSVVTHALFWNHEWFSALKLGYVHWRKIKEGHISKFKTCKIY